MSAINAKVIQELRGLETPDNPHFLSEVIDLFLKEVDGHLLKLREALRTQDQRSFERSAHTLKGSCGNLGAQVMSKMCADLHALAKQASWDPAKDLLTRVETEFVDVRVELEAQKQLGC